MITRFIRKTVSFGLRGALGIACSAAFMSFTAPAKAYFVGGHFVPHYYPHYYGGFGFGVGVGLGLGCCWGYPYYWPGYYPYAPAYPYYTPYVSYPITTGDDMTLASPYVQQALAAPIGNTIQWGNGDTHGNVTTLRDGWAGQNYCREIRQNVTVDGKSREIVNTACRPPNGSWHLVPNQ